MELKLPKALAADRRAIVLIEPLWNWNAARNRAICADGLY